MTDDDKRNARGTPDEATLAAIRAFIRDAQAAYDNVPAEGPVYDWCLRFGEDVHEAARELLAALDAVRAELAENEGVIAVWRRRTNEAEERERALREALGHIAAIAHSGGLIGMSEADAMVAIRRLSLQAWDKGGAEEQLRKRVRAAALAATRKGAGA